MNDRDRPTAHAEAGAVQLHPPTGWTAGTPLVLSPEAARELAAELLAAALTAKFAPGGLG